MIKVDKSRDWKHTHGKNVYMSTVKHEAGGLFIRVSDNTSIDLNGKIARQIYQVLKKHYETK